jgi:hypothetical protein
VVLNDIFFWHDSFSWFCIHVVVVGLQLYRVRLNLRTLLTSTPRGCNTARTVLVNIHMTAYH